MSEQKKRRAWNSTLPAPEKPLPRHTPLAKSGETKRKARERYRAYLKSPEWKARRQACFERAGMRCEVWWEPAAIGNRPNLEGRGRRCHFRPDHAHHKTYARFGNELPEDLAACCRMCHRAIEQEYFPHRNGNGSPERIGNIVERALDRLIEGIGDDE